LSIIFGIFGCRGREEPKEEKIKITVEQEEPARGVSLGSAHEQASLGKKLAQAEDYAGAEKAYQKALELNPRYAYAYNQLGYLYQVKYQNYEKAIYHYQKAIEYNPTKSAQMSRFQLAICYEKAGQIDNAINTWKAYLEIEPADSSYALKARQHLENLQTQK
ncbi:tetratricopeptide repeat protein, partial [bacterium]|nr:tetratricopeptide repeat protein [bacterium]